MSKRIGVSNVNTLARLLDWFGRPAIFLYLICMFVAPTLTSNFDWIYIQNVWDRWQSLNMGMLALISSIAAFNISRYNASKQRERDFIAAKAFLPSALSDLSHYFESSADALKAGWDQRAGGIILTSTQTELPIAAEGYKEIIGNCIKSAPPEIGEFLAVILVNLQIHESRLRGIVESLNSTERTVPNKAYIISCMYKLGELQALVNEIFEYARGSEDFESGPLQWEDFKTAYSNLGITVETYTTVSVSLMEYTTTRVVGKEAVPDASD